MDHAAAPAQLQAISYAIRVTEHLLLVEPIGTGRRVGAAWDG